ncbi:hypothetical protein BJ742DRAFT_192100 [Cladochytrium replicatum]|nr:hypothetical protein BJ742DRAFT_192100 [Cladochytrium replicatum]
MHPFNRNHFVYDLSAPDEFYQKEYTRIQNAKQSWINTLRNANANKTAADFFEFCVDSHPEQPAVAAVDHPTKYTFRELDEAANRIAHWAISPRVALKQGDVAALLMENRPEFLAITMGLAKVGVTIALINTNLKASLLGHAVATSGARVIIVSSSKRSNWEAIQLPPGASLDSFNIWSFDGTLNGWEGSNSLDSAIADMPTSRLDGSVRDNIGERDPLYYIFTSGTTGPSKAAKFSHRRFVGAAVTWAEPSGLKQGDRYYITLPLYHGNGGVVAVAPCYLLGNEIILREKFSASNFFKDVREHQCVATVYIGELWRYLHAQPPHPDEGTPKFSPLRVAIGNGLRGEIWEAVTKRFHITHVVEHYGSTEMPGDAVLNYFNKPGACGYLPIEEARKKSMTGEGGQLVRYDVEEDRVLRNDATGFCVPCGPGEVGEMIMRLPEGSYDGYVGEAATRRKLYTDVFEKGDAWWSSGDLLKADEVGFFYFVDRAGDSYRWKGENVSTNEVQAVISAFPGIVEANVYGIRIPNSDGRAGMASIVLSPAVTTSTFDFASLTRHIEQNLPTYARPIFVRLRSEEIEKTSTLKFQKFAYASEGYDPTKVVDPVFCYVSPTQGKTSKGESGWVRVENNLLNDIQHGLIRF